MKSLRFIALGAALALLPQAADAASRVRRNTVQPPPAEEPDAGSYYVPYVTDKAGNKVPIMEVPGSVVVVPRQVMDDQHDTSVCGALRNVSGVFCR